MKGNKRSHRSSKPSFPKTAPMGTATGNDKYGVVEVHRPKHPPSLVLTINGRPVPFPIATVQNANKVRMLGHIPENFLTDVEPDMQYWQSISQAIYPKTHKALQAGQPQGELLEIFALEVASISKNASTILDSMPTRLFGPMQKAIRKKSPWQRLDELDLLLLRSYRQKGWDLLRMAEVGKICGKLLKRKTIPATTIKDRTTELNLQTKLKAGAQNKF